MTALEIVKVIEDTLRQHKFDYLGTVTISQVCASARDAIHADENGKPNKTPKARPKEDNDAILP